LDLSSFTAYFLNERRCSMEIMDLLKETEKFEIQAYKRPRDIRQLRATHLPYSGSAHKHPYDSRKIILLPDPYSPHSLYLEFRIRDISYVEELPSAVNLDGETVMMARIWVRKGSFGLLCSPFVVEDTRNIEAMQPSGR
jgi:inorganic pyrophosphatase